MLPRHLRIVIGGACLWALVGCNGCLGIPSPVDRTGTLPKSCDETPQQPPADKVDILFVIDDSNSMAEEQAGVVSQLTSFSNAISVLGGVTQSLRFGVVSTSVYQNSTFGLLDCDPQTPGGEAYCDASGRLKGMVDADDPSFITRLSTLVTQGTSGSGQETPFEALRLAFKDPRNAGFLRDGARLLIIVLSDEDDCSENVRPPRVVVGTDRSMDYCRDQSANLTPVADYYAILKDVRDSHGALKDITYAAIAPVGITDKAVQGIVDTLPDGTRQVRNIDCPTSVEPGFRHRAMADLFRADHENLDSICKADYRDTLLKIADLLTVSQFLDLQGVTDPALLKLTITRADGTVVPCTVDNGLKYSEPMKLSDGTYSSARVEFVDQCQRSRDDLKLQVQRVCVF